MSPVDNIMSAFMDEDFQSMLQNKRIEIEKILKEYIKTLSDKKVSKIYGIRGISSHSFHQLPVLILLLIYF